MNRHTFIVIAISAMSLWAVSCAKLDQAVAYTDSSRELILEACIDESEGMNTRAQSIVETSYLPSSYTIHVTSWFTPDDSTPGSAYFTDAPFNYTSGNVWKSDTYQYWPIGGSLDFLCIASDDSILNLTDLEAFRWNASKATSSVTIEIPNTQSKQADVLYASARPTSESNRVSLHLKHSQALLDFEIGSDEDGLIRVDGLNIGGVYMQGRLKITNNITGGTPQASWDYSYAYPVTAYVHDVEGVILTGSSPSAEGLLLIPAQAVGDLRITYTTRTNPDIPWTEGTTYTKSLPPATSEWEQGKKYTYRIKIGLDVSNILIESVTVTPWVYGEETELQLE